MAIVQKLTDLGFMSVEATGEVKGVTTVRVRTSKGWVYEKFSSAGQVETWAKFHEPEAV